MSAPVKIRAGLGAARFLLLLGGGELLPVSKKGDGAAQKNQG